MVRLNPGGYVQGYVLLAVIALKIHDFIYVIHLVDYARLVH